MNFLITVVLKGLLIGVLALWLSAGWRAFRRKKRHLFTSKTSKRKGEKIRGLSERQSEEYRKLIEDYLQSGTSHLNSDFRMHTMVEETGIPRHHLSAIINSVYCTNFNTFINEHRIAYILQHFNQPEWAHLTFEGIGQEAGFKSRSTFIRAFKQVTGMTPSKFRKQCKSSNNDKKTAITTNHTSADDRYRWINGSSANFLDPRPGSSAGSA